MFTEGLQAVTLPRNFYFYGETMETLFFKLMLINQRKSFFLIERFSFKSYIQYFRYKLLQQ